jgi:hypothetical protein
MLSITHHTRKRPSTGLRTTHGPQSPPWWVHWQHTHIVTREKRKRKETNKKKLQQAIESQRKAKSKIAWKRKVLVPLGKGNGSTQLRQNKLTTKEQTTKACKSSPCTNAYSPWIRANTGHRPVRPVSTNLSVRLPKSIRPIWYSRPHPPKAENAKEMHKLPLDSWDRF